MSVPLINQGVNGFVKMSKEFSRVDKAILNVFNVKSCDQLDTVVIQKVYGKDICDNYGQLSQKGRTIMKSILNHFGLSAQATLDEVIKRATFFTQHPGIDVRFFYLKDLVSNIPGKLSGIMKNIYDSVINKPWSEENLEHNFGNAAVFYTKILPFIDNP